MSEKVLIVEDELIVAKDLKMILEGAGYEVCGIATSVPKALDIINHQTPDVVLLDIFLKGPLTGIQLAGQLNERNIPFVYLSANSNQSTIEEAKRTRPYGFMVKPFREEEVLISLEIARYRHQNSIEAQLQKEFQLQEQLKKIPAMDGSLEQKLLAVTAALQPFIAFDFMEIGKHYSSIGSSQWFGFFRTGYYEYQIVGFRELMTMAAISEHQFEKIREDTPKEFHTSYFNGEEFRAYLTTHPFKGLIAKVFGINSNILMPLYIDEGQPYVLSFYSKAQQAYDAKTLQFLGRMQQTINHLFLSLCAEHNTQASILQRINPGHSNIPKDNLAGIIGNSQALLSVLDYVKQVSIVDTTVLIFGETGTGKEKIADQIHLLSPRKDKPFVKVNCAAIPVNLLESELFGHERGAFTGAINRRIGKFEQANGGTIFLDEIGDVPLDMQVKLLRVLQQREIERIGGRNTIKIDVRVIAATNKNLEKEIAEGRFRTDLYFRLNVFPLWLPPLRKRIEDIPLLAHHFVGLYAGRHKKDITGIEPGAMDQLMQYEWPGNIRELENSIERSVVLTSGSTIEKVFIQAPHLQQHYQAEGQAVKSIEEVEKEHILKVLIKCNYKVYGADGAAAMLQIPPTTLTSKMKKLGIIKDKSL